MHKKIKNTHKREKNKKLYCTCCSLIFKIYISQRIHFVWATEECGFEFSYKMAEKIPFSKSCHESLHSTCIIMF